MKVVVSGGYVLNKLEQTWPLYIDITTLVDCLFGIGLKFGPSFMVRILLGFLFTRQLLDIIT